MNFFSPAEVANNFMKVGKTKGNLPLGKMILLGIMAGMFIALGGVGAATVSVSIPLASVGKFVGGMVFPVGLTMVVCAGGELFTGNCMMAAPWVQKEITLAQLLRNWIVVYFANYIGGILIAACVVFSHTPDMFGNGLSVAIISTAASKCSLTIGDSFLRGILCNILVCIAVWIGLAAKDIAGKVIGMFLPVMLFVGCGFEHSVANMYFLTAGVFAKHIAPYAQAAAEAGVNLDAINAGSIVHNLVPVTIGNIVGGAAVGLIYWACFVRKGKEE